MLKDGEQLSEITRQVIRQQCFQDWESLSNLKRQGIHQHCFMIGNSSAM